VEERLAAGLPKPQIAKLIEDERIYARQVIGDVSLPAGLRFRSEPFHEIDHGLNAAACACADARRYSLRE